MSILELETTLQRARERELNAVKALSSKHQGGELQEFRAAHEAVLQAERALAAAKGEPYALPVDFPVSWSAGAPLPYLLQNDHKTFLVFFLRTIDPNWDGSYVKVRHPGSSIPKGLAVVEFKLCVCTKMGTLNDEVFRGHPLHGKGFTGYRALVVENSMWLKELEAINAVHSNYKPEHWRDLKHYILPFHDSTFECVARSFEVETRQATLPDVLAEICERLVK